MPTTPFSPAAAEHYLGFAKQASKGTGVAPTFFAAFVEAVDLSHKQAIRSVREGGSGLFVARDVKDVHPPGTRFAAPIRPDLGGAVLAFLLGTDTISGASDPFTHTITPNLAATTWLSIERNINDELTERIVDSFIMEVVLNFQKRDSGPEAMMDIIADGLSLARQASQATDTYEGDRPFLRSDGVWTIDGNAETNVERATVTLRWIFDTAMLADSVTRTDATKIQFEADIETVQIINAAADLNAYIGTHYGTITGTAASETVFGATANAFTVNMNYTAAFNRQFQLAIPAVNWTEAKWTEPNPGATEAARMTRNGHLVAPASGAAVTVTVQNANGTSYTA